MPSSKSRVTEKGKPEVSKTGNTWWGHASTVDEMLFRAAHRPVFVAAFAPHFALRQHVPGVQHHLERPAVRCQELRCLGVGVRVSALIYTRAGAKTYKRNVHAKSRKRSRVKNRDLTKKKEDAPKAGRKQDKGWEMSIMGFDSR